MLHRRELVIQRNQHPAAKENRIRRNQPLRLIRHDDRRTIPNLELRVLQSTAKWTRHLLEVGVCKAHLLAVAIRFNQAGFVGPALQRIPQRRAQAGILTEIKHSQFVSVETPKQTEKKEYIRK